MPRILPTLGLVGSPILIASVITAVFRTNHQVIVLAAIGTLPIAAWEFSLGVWLVVKGFNTSPTTAANLPSPVRDSEGELVPSIA